MMFRCKTCGESHHTDEVPIRGEERTFTWGVWVSLSEASFDEMAEHWEDPERTALGPYIMRPLHE